MQEFPRPADLPDVTAMAMSGVPVSRPRAVAPAPSATRALLGSFHEPNMITVSILAATGIVIAARHPIARMLGTEVDTPPISTTTATAPLTPPSTSTRAPALSLPAPVPTHSPRDPFASLVSSSGQLLASATQSVEQAVTKVVTRTPTTAPAAASVTATSTCAGSMHRVAAGESLWTLAARAVRSNDVGTVNIAWRRIYSANRHVLSNPSIIHIGQNICVPTKLS
jgi:nucleoid-associated protein YgaU